MGDNCVCEPPPSSCTELGSCWGPYQLQGPSWSRAVRKDRGLPAISHHPPVP